MIQFLDPNVVQFEILPHLDDRSVISLLSTCKIVNQVISIPDYIETKLKIMDEEILSQKFNELEQSPIQVNRINEIFRLAYLNFREGMFQTEKQLLGTVKVDEAQCYGKLKSQYTLLQRYVFKNSDKLSPHCNRSVFSGSTGFWNSHSVDFKISKENTVYYWSIVLTAFDRKISNSWAILVGFAEEDAASSLSKSWIPSGYCVKSNAILENSYTSYTESLVNTEGDVIGIECYVQNKTVYFNVYSPSRNHQTFQFKSVNSNIVPMVSMVHSQSLQLLSLLPWDGHVESLKSFGECATRICTAEE
ncbi:hypothetical protein NAEGRDRAFT_81123 [Naegleria gruberi]|uniref:F-box domain-containing protein n=1 Tax=Naegleria gruberi TaxID=5762 RepID=D2VT11_NAEGR|nr:uncharacterized protein NAEGRDRAFT_81123 [Naegleria gruberi]EFC40002.1 hypothetical protein NAEGRDRAFT_81123 [Naegleria gruberi]|eukprot:XP_002672746.1 hypothetical protein NAEGRDRAFT_81123 [Naegleria gruberi strain NEG-M]